MSEKYRYWTFVVYPESAPQDWKDKLLHTMVPCAVSPLHKADDETGKPHYHVLLGFNRAVGMNTAVKVSNVSGGANGFVQRVLAPSGAFEYLTHKNNPDKEQFEGVHAELFNGFKVPSIKLDDDLMFDEVISLIFEYNIAEFCDLVKVYRDSGQVDKASWVLRHAYALNTLIRSYSFQQAEYAVQNRPRIKDDGFRKLESSSPFDDVVGEAPALPATPPCGCAELSNQQMDIFDYLGGVDDE